MAIGGGTDEGDLNILEKMIRMIDKYGFLKVLKAIFVISLFIYAIYNVSNIGSVVEAAFDEQRKRHDMAIEYREEIDPIIRLQLNQLLLNTGCNRAFVIEMHNGEKNMAGLPFKKGEMTYEEVSAGTVRIDEDYTNLNLSRFPFTTYLKDHISWYGSTQELRKIDEKIALRLESNDTKYIFIKCLYASNGKETAYLGITYNKEQDFTPEQILKIRDYAEKASNIIVTKLDITKFEF